MRLCYVLFKFCFVLLCGVCWVQLISDLIERGCFLNIREVNMLPQLYIQYSSMDSVQLSPRNIGKGGKGDKGAKSTLLVKSVAKRDELKKSGKMAPQDLGELKFSCNLGIVNYITRLCEMHVPFITDANKNNPLHLYCMTQNPITNVKSNQNIGGGGDYNSLWFEQCNVIKLLKCQCKEWLVQENLLGKLPLDVAIEYRHAHLMEALLFESKEFGQEEEKKRSDDDGSDDDEIDEMLELEANDVLHNGTIVNKALLSKFQNKSNESGVGSHDLLCKWIIELSNEILSRYLRDIEMNGKRVKILDCDIDDRVFGQYIEYNTTNQHKMAILRMILKCVNSKSSDDFIELTKMCQETDQLYIGQFLNHYLDYQYYDGYIFTQYASNRRDAIAREKSAAEQEKARKKAEMSGKVDARQTAEIIEEQEKRKRLKIELLERKAREKSADVTITTEKKNETKDDKEKHREKEEKGSGDAIMSSTDTSLGTMIDGDDEKNGLINSENMDISIDLTNDENILDAERKIAERLAQEEDELQRKKPVTWLEMVYALIVESLSTLDFITDYFVLIQLYNGHPWWTSWMLLLMISPYLVSYSVLGTIFQKRIMSLFELEEKNVNTMHSKCKSIGMGFMCLCLMTPLSLIYFVVIDVFFMIYVLFSTLLYFISCGNIDIKDVVDDLVFQKLLRMDRMGIIGYRRLRTLSQLLWESCPQLILQGRILYAIENEQTDGLDDINVPSLLISIGIAGLHALFEISILYLDSQASSSNIFTYGLICLGARFDWVPYSGILTKKLRQQIDTIAAHSDETGEIEEINSLTSNYNNHAKYYHVFDYERMIASFCCLDYAIEFKFSNESIRKLASYFIYLPLPSVSQATQANSSSKNKRQKQYFSNIVKKNTAIRNPMLQTVISSQIMSDFQIHILLGKESIRNVGLFALADVYRSGHKKVTFNSNELDWNRIIFNNTPITRDTRDFILMIFQEFIGYAEILPITAMLGLGESASGLNLEMSINDVKEYILLSVFRAGDDSADTSGGDGQLVQVSSNQGRKQEINNKMNNSIAIDDNEFLFVLRQYHSQKVLFGLSCDEISIIYEQIYHYITSGATNDQSYFYVILLYLWYTQGQIEFHGCCSFHKKCRLKQFLMDKEQERNNDTNDRMYNLITNSYYYPKFLPIQYIGNNEKYAEYCNTKQRLYFSFGLCESLHAHQRQLEKLMLVQCGQAPSVAIGVSKMGGMDFLLLCFFVFLFFVGNLIFVVLL